MKRRQDPQAITADEQIARYAYVLGTVPASVADRAFAAAFSYLAPVDRETIIGQLTSELPGRPQEPPSLDPDAFATLMRDLASRDALVRIDDAALLAAAFVRSPPIAAYFTSGPGSLTMDRQPPWIHSLAGHETAPVDAGRMHHRHWLPGLGGVDGRNTGDSRDW